MKRWEIRGEGIAGLQQVDADEPAPGQGEVLVRVRATSLNYRDLMVVEGRYKGAGGKGLVPLSDGAGEIVAVGPGVTHFRVGDRVAGNFFQGWHEGPWRGEYAATALGGAIDGMLSELVVLKEQGCVRIPDGYSFEQAATLPCAAVTAWNAVVTHGELLSSETVLVQGSGGVSVFALQIARSLGADIVATSGSPAKMDRLRELGARAVVDYKANPDWEKAVQAETGKLGVDLVVEVGGPGTLERSIRALKHGGHISLVGVLAGGQQAANVFGLAMKNATMRGIYVGSSAEFSAMNRFLVQQHIEPVVDSVFPFDKAPEAYQHLKAGAHLGKVVIAGR